MPQIVCISHLRWEDALVRTRLLLPLSPDTELLFFEPAIPLLSFAEHRLRRPRDGQVDSPNITLYTLPSPVSAEEDYATMAPRQIRKNSAYIQKAMEQNHFHSPLIWCTSPLCAGLPETLPRSGVIYDCGESWALSAPPVWESRLCDLADVVFAASPLLQARLQSWCHNLVLLPNGYHREQYALPPGQPLRTPADLAGIPTPIFGAVGNLPSRCDLSPLVYAARSMPAWSFVLAGEVSPYHPQLQDLKALPNVYLLGPKSPVSHPHYLRHFDVCLELLDGEPAPEALSSVFYGYLHTGAPIVLLSEQDAPLFADVTYPAHFDIEFLDACRRALAEDSELLRRTRQGYAAEADWPLRRKACLRILRASALL